MTGTGRVVASAAIVAAWIGGMGMLVRREYFRPQIERLAEAALRVTPSATFFAVMQGDRQVGFASSTVDTAATMIEQRDYLVADIPVGGRIHRATARTNVELTRTLRVRSFEIAFDVEQTPTRVRGRVHGDSALELVVGTGSSTDTQRIALKGPMLLPTLAPLAVALENRPGVGKSYVLPLFDHAALAPRDVRLDIRAESLFVVNDSSVFDSASGRWRAALPDTVRGWHVVPQSGGGITGWVDQQGRLLASSQFGFRLVRLPYEVAFENWRLDSESMPPPTRATSSDRDVLETTAIAANKRLRASVRELRARLGGVDLAGFDLNGGRQQYRGDTLIVRREEEAALTPRYTAILDPVGRSRFADLKAETFLEVQHPEIVALAERLRFGSDDVRVIAQRINRWVHDSVRKEPSIGIPSALHVLHTRRGDCNEHAQLFVALARAAGVRARIASGLAYIDGKFYYHAWPEVLLRGWVAVDPTFGQFPADAAHLRFVIGGFGRQTELLRLVGGLTIDIIETR